jgi:uncharacterized protein YndB with AHSA1/START domain
METKTKTKVTITVKSTVKAPVEKVWKFWTDPEHIKNWNFATEDWHTPWAKNDLRIGGKFTARMEAKDGSTGFDFEGIYEDIAVNKFIAYRIGDGRKVRITFSGNDQQTDVVEKFEAESVNPIEMQRGGWQSILDNFKKYVESRSK